MKVEVCKKHRNKIDSSAFVKEVFVESDFYKEKYRIVSSGGIKRVYVHRFEDDFDDYALIGDLVDKGRMTYNDAIENIKNKIY